jgi:hypothetical protein
MDLEKKWRVVVWRFYSMLASEVVSLETYKDYHDETPKIYDDKYFRDNSYRLEENNITSKAEFIIAPGI